MIVGSGFFLLFFLFAVAGVPAGIVTAVQAAAYPEWAFERAGTTKFVWQVIPIVLIFVCGPAAVVMWAVWNGKRREVANAAAAGAPPGWGYGPQGYSQPYVPPGYQPPTPPPSQPPGPPPPPPPQSEPPPPPSPYGPQQ